MYKQAVAQLDIRVSETSAAGNCLYRTRQACALVIFVIFIFTSFKTFSGEIASSEKSGQASLPQHYQPLETSENCEYPGNNNQMPIIRRALVCIFGFLIGSFIIISGFYNINNERIIFGSALVGAGTLCGFIGMALWVANDFPCTWSWWL
jgi:hypothetical protein